MSNLVVDDIPFYHGGAQDLGPNMKVVANFGPVSKQGVGKTALSTEQNISVTQTSALKKARRQIAEQAKKLGATAVICHGYTSTFLIGVSELQCGVSAYGDAVIIQPKESSS